MYLLLFVIALLFIYKYFYLPLNYWHNKNVPCVKTTLFIGNIELLYVLLKKISFAEVFQKYHQMFNARYVGVILVTRPFLILKDLNLIKEIWVQNYEHFLNHADAFIFDPILKKSLAVAKNQLWKDLRYTISPVFTGMKVKLMFGLVKDCVDNFIDYFKEELSDKDVVEINAKETFSRLTNDVIASTAFGANTNAVRNPEDEFYLVGKRITKTSGFMAIKVMLAILVPNVMKVLGVRMFPQECMDFFKNLIVTNIEYRKKHGIVRLDLVQMLINTRNGNEIESDNERNKYEETMNECPIKVDGNHINLSIDAITAQAVIFYFAGFDTTSSLLAFISYELAYNQDVQENLRKEIKKTMIKDKEIDYNKLNEMQYLHMVVSETMRKWPAAYLYTRQCTKDYVIKAVDKTETDLHLKVGDVVAIPALGLHRDPDYFPDPDKFDPERFNPSKSDDIARYTFLPFSTGPRNCIASRLALMVVKMLTIHLVANFQLVLTKNSPIPLKYKRLNITVDGEGGIFIGLQKLQKSTTL